MVFRVERAGTRWQVFTEGRRYEAECVIWAAPTWLASWVVDPPPPRWPMDTAPWLVSNLTLERWPRDKGYPPCWDNVIYKSPSLGYVIATHQNVARHQDRTVWTHYWALADGRGADQRRILLGGDWNYWSEKVLTDLERAHPDIRQCVSRIDIFRIAHAMPRPAAGLIFDERRLARLRPKDGFAYANCDLSALSLFEEAQYRGVEAASSRSRPRGALAGPVEAFGTNRTASSRVLSAPSSCSSSTACEDLLEAGAGGEAEFDQVVAGDQRRGAQLLGREFGLIQAARLFIAIERAETAEQIEAVELELLVEIGQAEERLRAAVPMRGRSRKRMWCLTSETVASMTRRGIAGAEDVAAIIRAGFGVAIEADAIRESEGRRLANIVQQGGERERERRIGRAGFRAAAGCGSRRRLRGGTSGAEARPSCAAASGRRMSSSRRRRGVRNRGARRPR
jgi:hypothetical protein